MERAYALAGHASLEEERNMQGWPDRGVKQADDGLGETSRLKWSWIGMGDGECTDIHTR